MKPFNDTYVMYQLLEFIDENSIICLCKASKKLNEICKQYIKMENDKRFKIDANFFKIYCHDNHIILLLKLIITLEEIGLSNYLNWNTGLVYACEGGHMDIIKIMVGKGAGFWLRGLEGACKNGHIVITKLMFEKGATRCWYCNKSREEHLKK